MEINMVLPASYAGYTDEDYGINIPTVEDYKKLGKFAAETFTPYGDIQTGKDAYNAYQQGEYLKALANAGLIGLGYTPFGLVARPVGRLGKRALNAVVDPDYRSLGDILGNPASMPYRGVGADVGPLSEAAQIARLMKANRDKYNLEEFFNFVANKKPGSSYFHISKIPNLDKDNFNYLSGKLDFDDAHKGIFPEGATSREGAFVVDTPEDVLALRQQGGQFGPFSDYKNTYIFRANPDKAQPKFQPMKKTKANDPMVMEGYLPKESITSMEKILTAKNLEEFFRRKKK